MDSFTLVHRKQIWKHNMHECLKFFLWKVAWDIYPTRMKIAEKLRGNFSGPIFCPLRGASEESLHHLFFSCIYSKFIGRLAPWPLSVAVFASSPIAQWVQALLAPSRILGVSDNETQEFQLYVVICPTFSMALS